MNILYCNFLLFFSCIHLQRLPDENCVSMQRTGKETDLAKWQHHPCSHKKPYLCQALRGKRTIFAPTYHDHCCSLMTILIECFLVLLIFSHILSPHIESLILFSKFSCQGVLLFMHLTLLICFKTLVQRDGKDEDPFKDQYETTKCGNDAFLYHDRCFRFYDVRKTWAEAQKECNDQEAVLVNTEDTFEGARLTYEAFRAGKHQKFWTGIKFDEVRIDCFFFRCIC